MKTKISTFRTLLILATAVFVVSACSEEVKKPLIPLAATEVKDLAADPNLAAPGGPPKYTKKYTLFSFKDNKIIPNSDSASTKWDIGFRATSIILNGGISGPGKAAGQLVSGLFDEMLIAPTDGYVQDATGNVFGVPASWYNYTGSSLKPNNAVITVPGKIIMIKTADGKFAKIEILSYYKGNPNTTTPEFDNFATRPAPRYYTFKFIYQPDGTPNLKDTK